MINSKMHPGDASLMREGRPTAAAVTQLTRSKHKRGESVFARLYNQETCASSKQLYHSCSWCLKTKILASYNPKSGTPAPTRRFSEDLLLRASQSTWELRPLHRSSPHTNQPAPPPPLSRWNSKITAGKLEKRGGQLPALKEKPHLHSATEMNFSKTSMSRAAAGKSSGPLATAIISKPEPPSHEEDQSLDESVQSKNKVMNWLCFKHEDDTVTDTAESTNQQTL